MEAVISPEVSFVVHLRIGWSWGEMSTCHILFVLLRRRRCVRVRWRWTRNLMLTRLLRFALPCLAFAFLQLLLLLFGLVGLSHLLLRTRKILHEVFVVLYQPAWLYLSFDLRTSRPLSSRMTLSSSSSSGSEGSRDINSSAACSFANRARRAFSAISAAEGIADCC